MSNIRRSCSSLARIGATMTERAYAKGSTCPPLGRNKLRLYSMRFCAYAHTTRLVLAHKDIQHELVNVNLKKKPDWFFKKNPLALVPVLELNDRIVYESDICNEYLDKMYPQKKLIPEDEFQRAKDRMTAARFAKLVKRLYELGRADTENKGIFLEKIHKYLDGFESQLQDKYFGGSSPSMLDFTIWPWFERISALSEAANVDFLLNERYPTLRAYVKTMFQLPAVRKTMMDSGMHTVFVKGLFSGNPDYDYGLPENSKL